MLSFRCVWECTSYTIHNMWFLKKILAWSRWSQFIPTSSGDNHGITVWMQYYLPRLFRREKIYSREFYTERHVSRDFWNFDVLYGHSARDLLPALSFRVFISVGFISANQTVIFLQLYKGRILQMCVIVHFTVLD